MKWTTDAFNMASPDPLETWLHILIALKEAIRAIICFALPECLEKGESFNISSSKMLSEAAFSTNLIQWRPFEECFVFWHFSSENLIGFLLCCIDLSKSFYDSNFFCFFNFCILLSIRRTTPFLMLNLPPFANCYSSSPFLPSLLLNELRYCWSLRWKTSIIYGLKMTQNHEFCNLPLFMECFKFHFKKCSISVKSVKTYR